MNRRNIMEDQLWDYIDGNCSVDDIKFIKDLLDTNKVWANKYEELIKLHQLIGESIRLDKPSSSLLPGVMKEVGEFRLAAIPKRYINRNIIRAISTCVLFSIGALLTVAFLQVNWSAPGGVNAIVSINFDFDYSKIFNSAYTNIFIMVNIVLGFILLDIYMGKRKTGYQLQQ